MRLKDYRGKVVLLSSWATWSDPSKTEVAVLNELEENFMFKGLVVIGISYDDTADQVREFQKQYPQIYKIGLGGQAIEGQLAAKPLPTTYIIDRRGKIRTRLTGVQHRQTLEAAIQPLLSESNTDCPVSAWLQKDELEIHCRTITINRLPAVLIHRLSASQSSPADTHTHNQIAARKVY